MSVPGQGISFDIFNLFRSFLNQGKGVQDDARIQTTNVPVKLCANANYIVTCITILADSLNAQTIYVSYHSGGSASSVSFPLIPGAAVSLWFKNPVISNLQVRGTVGDTVHAIG